MFPVNYGLADWCDKNEPYSLLFRLHWTCGNSAGHLRTAQIYNEQFKYYARGVRINLNLRITSLGLGYVRLDLRISRAYFESIFLERASCVVVALAFQKQRQPSKHLPPHKASSVTHIKQYINIYNALVTSRRRNTNAHRSVTIIILAHQRLG